LLNNAVLALILVVFTCILGLLAAARVALSPGAPRAT